MSAFLLYDPASSVTGKALAQSLKDAGASLSFGKEPPEKKVDVLIRWGSYKQVAVKPGRVINTMEAVKSASDKLGALKKLADNRISIPKVFMDAASIRPEDYPVLGRQVHHVGGNDISICLQSNDVPRAKQAGAQYFVKYIPTKAEYRIHVFGDDVLKVSQKLLTNPELATQPWVRNLGAGYTFHSPHLKTTATIRGLAVDAVQVLGLKFGAVDLILGDDSNPYILEVNTAPGLIEDGIDRYTQRLLEEINK